jgi:hypothetical protein
MQATELAAVLGGTTVPCPAYPVAELPRVICVVCGYTWVFNTIDYPEMWTEQAARKMLTETHGWMVTDGGWLCDRCQKDGK